MPQTKHMAVLDCQGSEFPGYWECQYGYSEEHEHCDYEIEILEYPSSNPDSSYVYTQEVYVCGVCGVVIEDSSPASDRAEALADMQIMEALGK